MRNLEWRRKVRERKKGAEKKERERKKGGEKKKTNEGRRKGKREREIYNGGER
jgi:hypothetical protein